MREPGPVAAGLARRVVDAAFAEVDPGDPALGVERSLELVTEAVLGVIGQSGFEAVLGRAVHLARPRAPWWSTGDELRAAIERHPPEAVRDGALGVLEHLFGLLCHFIGEGLTTSVTERALAGRTAWRAVGSEPEEGPGT